MNWGSVSLNQVKPANEHATTSKWVPLLPQYQTVNKYFQQPSQVATTITKYNVDHSVETKNDSKTGISYPMISNMILPAYYLSIIVVVLFVETKITSIAIIAQNWSEIRLRGSCYSMRCGHTRLTQKSWRGKTAIIISHMGLWITSIALILK